jgi:uncharacterized protein
MMRRPAPIALLCAALLAAVALLPGCATSPPSRFYTLSAVAMTVPTPPAGMAPAAVAAPPATAALFVAVGPVTVPSVVDRPEFVVSTGSNELRLDEFNRWAAPLQDNLARVIAENLVVMLGTPRVILFPQALATDPDYRVAVEIRTFDSLPGTAAVLDAVWTIRRAKDGRTQTGRTSAREAVDNGSYEALAAAHSRAAGRLSQDVAAAIRELQRGG